MAAAAVAVADLEPANKKRKTEEVPGGLGEAPLTLASEENEFYNFEKEDNGVIEAYIKDPLTPVQRYYTQKFFIPNKVKDFNSGAYFGDQYVYLHTNKLCVVGITDMHPLITGKLPIDPKATTDASGESSDGASATASAAKSATGDSAVTTAANEVKETSNSEPRRIVSISFEGGKNSNRLDNKVKGTKKKGGQWLDPLSRLCEITCSDGTKYKVVAGVRGSLLEINQKLVTNPNLLLEKPMTEGYIAIIKPKVEESIETSKQLISEEEYKSRIAQLKSE